MDTSGSDGDLAEHGERAVVGTVSRGLDLLVAVRLLLFKLLVREGDHIEMAGT